MARTRTIALVTLSLLYAPSFGQSSPLSGEFTYQGQLSVSGQPANGSYELCFGLWDSATGGTSIGAVQIAPGVPISNGLFTVTLNAAGEFGASAFNGQERWLQIGLIPPGSIGFTMLTPRQKVTATPYALFAAAPWSSSAGNIAYVGGNVGIGTASPASKLSVAGLIQSISGGFKFPDGTVQTTASSGGGGFSLPYAGEVASSTPAFSVTNTSGTMAIRGLATNTGGAINYGGYFEAYGSQGRAVAGSAASSNGFAGYFQGRGYFSGNVGIGTSAPAGRLDVRGGDLIVDSSSGGLCIGYGGTGDGWRYTTGDGGQTLLLQERPGGASGETRVTLKSGGNVGIGTTLPQRRLDVDGGDIQVRGPGSFDATGEEATLWLGDANHYIKGIYGKGVAIGTWWVGDAMYVTEPYGWIGIGTDQPQADLHVDGRTRTNVLEIVGGSDLAEPFVVNEPSAISDQRSVADEATGAGDGSTHRSSLITPRSAAVEPGMVVVIDPEKPGQLTLAAEAYDRKVAGVISGAKGLNPGMIMRAAGTEQGDGDHPVALSGRVWCWCDAKYGPIVPGDRLTTSASPGHAMRVTDRERADGAVLGKAMTSLENGTGLVLVLVTLQ
ncbi:MAG: hypothetical protein KA354_22110 [Phycisphaerae bacterium]|nr:hypothetical protein [Phycisphaerae bacterium]